LTLRALTLRPREIRDFLAGRRPDRLATFALPAAVYDRLFGFGLVQQSTAAAERNRHQRLFSW